MISYMISYRARFKVLPEMSRAERAASGRAKTMNNPHCPALRRRRRGEAASSGEAALWLHWKGKSLVYCACPLISRQPRLGTRPGGLGETQAVTVADSDVLMVCTCHGLSRYHFKNPILVPLRTGMYYLALRTGMYCRVVCTSTY